MLAKQWSEKNAMERDHWEKDSMDGRIILQ